VLDKSLLLLAIKSFQFDGRPGVDTLAASLRSDLAAAVADAVGVGGFHNPEQWTPELGEWPEYPGGLPSTLAVAGHALHAVGALDHPTQAGLAKRLVESFGGDAFGSTFETSFTLVHSEWLIRDELRAAASEPRLRLEVGGRALPESSLTRRPTLGGVDLSVDPAAAAQGPITVDASQDLTVHVDLAREVPLDQAAPVAAGWELRKELFRLDEHTGEATPLDGRVRIGDLVYVRLSFVPLQRSGPWWSSSYYALSDQVPAGFTVVDEDKLYDAAPFRLHLHEAGYKLRDLRADQIRWYFAFERGWMNRAFQTGYVMRAQFAGDYTAGVARLEDFYDASLFSQTAARRVGVDPLPRRAGR